MNTGIVLHNCQIVPDKAFEPDRLKTKNYLGRPWKDHSQTIIMESNIGDLIHPDGWMSFMNTNVGHDTVNYAEYGNKGPGADTTHRVKWPGYSVISKSEAAQYTVESFINTDNWLGKTGIPNTKGLMS